MSTYMKNITIPSGIEITATSLPGGLLAVHARKNNATLVVVWEADGTGHPVVDEMSDEESDQVFEAVKGEF